MAGEGEGDQGEVWVTRCKVDRAAGLREIHCDGGVSRHACTRVRRVWEAVLQGLLAYAAPHTSHNLCLQILLLHTRSASWTTPPPSSY